MTWEQRRTVLDLVHLIKESRRLTEAQAVGAAHPDAVLCV